MEQEVTISMSREGILFIFVQTLSPLWIWWSMSSVHNNLTCCSKFALITVASFLLGRGDGRKNMENKVEKNNLLFFVEIDLSILKVWRMLELAQIRKFINYCSNIATCYSSVKHETPCCCYWLVRIIYVAHDHEQITTTTNPCLLSPAELDPLGYY